MLNGIVSVEVAGAEWALLEELGGPVLEPDLVSALTSYRGHLMGRLAVLESRLLDAVTELDGEISDRTDQLSGNEREGEGQTDLEQAVEALEEARGSLEADLETLASLNEELSIGEDDPTAYGETVAGVAQDLLGMKRVYLQKDWDRALEELRGESEFAKLPHVRSQLESLGYPSLENF